MTAITTKFTALATAAAMVTALSLPTPAAALNQDERNIVGGVVLGVIGTLAVQGAKKKKTKKVYYCADSYKTYRNGKLVTVCR